MVDQQTAFSTGIKEPLPEFKPTLDGLSQTNRAWSVEDSENLYRIQGWGEPYFAINAAGHITVSPRGIGAGL